MELEKLLEELSRHPLNAEVFIRTYAGLEGWDCINEFVIETAKTAIPGQKALILTAPVRKSR